MTCKMYSIIDFPTFFEKVKSQPLPFKTSYRLTLLASEIEKHINFYQEKFRELLLTYGKKDENGELIPTEDGQGIKLIEEKIPECNEKIYELRNLDVELSDTKFDIDEFDKIELAPVEVYIIKNFLNE